MSNSAITQAIILGLSSVKNKDVLSFLKLKTNQLNTIGEYYIRVSLDGTIGEKITQFTFVQLWKEIVVEYVTFLKTRYSNEMEFWNVTTEAIQCNGFQDFINTFAAELIKTVGEIQKSVA